jgi:hypothetical protein
MLESPRRRRLEIGDLAGHCRSRRELTLAAVAQKGPGIRRANAAGTLRVRSTIVIPALFADVRPRPKNRG